MHDRQQINQIKIATHPFSILPLPMHMYTIKRRYICSESLMRSINNGKMEKSMPFKNRVN
jgi:hypothetical protein